MKKFRLVPLLASAGLVTALGFSSPLAPDALAQGAAAAPAKAKRAGKAKGAMRAPALTKRVLTGIEAKSGKALTDEQKTQLNAAHRTRQTAVEAAREKFLTDAAAITGLSVEEMREIEKPGRKKAATAAAP